jgi:hypothetical protein
MITSKRIRVSRVVHRVSRAVMVCALGASATACVADALPESTEGQFASTPSEEREATLPSELPGTLLAEMELQPGHVVRMWELDPGEIVVGGEVKMDEVPHVTPLLAPGDHPDTVVDMYKHMLAKAGRAVGDADVPQAVRDASRRAEVRDREMLAREALEPVAATQEVVEQPSVQTLSGECSADAYEDDYGAEWFRNEMCNKLHYNTATTNVESWSGQLKFTGVTWVGFAFLAADFVYGARGSITNYAHYSNPIFGDPSWTRKIIFRDVFFEPRMGEYWYLKSYGGSASMRGEGGPCARVHGCKMHSSGFIP